MDPYAAAARQAAPAGERIVGPLSAHIVGMVVPLLLYHGPAKWTPKRHWGACGQSCGCCRARLTDFGGCEVCEDGIELSSVSQGMLRVTRWYGAFHNDIACRCCCSRCREDWFDKGWICPGLYTADLFDDAQ